MQLYNARIKFHLKPYCQMIISRLRDDIKAIVLTGDGVGYLHQHAPLIRNTSLAQYIIANAQVDQCWKNVVSKAIRALEIYVSFFNRLRDLNYINPVNKEIFPPSRNNVSPNN